MPKKKPEDSGDALESRVRMLASVETVTTEGNPVILREGDYYRLDHEFRARVLSMTKKVRPQATEADPEPAPVDRPMAVDELDPLNPDLISSVKEDG